MVKWLKRIVKISWIALLAFTVLLNVRLYCATPLAPNAERIPQTLLEQLASNREAIESGAPESMQKLFPEGYFFCYVFHGLTWIELALRHPQLSNRALVEANWALQHLDSTAGRAPFPPDLPPNHGMFYSAWTCHLLAGIVAVEKASDKLTLERLRAHADQIKFHLGRSKTPFMASYHGSCWPCDTLPAVHAMSTYDRLTNESRYKSTIESWVSQCRERLEPNTNLIPHTSASVDGAPSSGARATSQVIILRFLPDIDPKFAKEQYTGFRNRFTSTFAGIPAIREYPSGVSGHGDVDSGPLIFGHSLSATVLSIGIAQQYGDQELADAIARSGEVVGLPWTSRGKKRYAAGLLPVGEIMVAYAYVARPWFEKDRHFPDTTFTVSRWWRAPTHLISSTLLLPWLVPLLCSRRKNQLNSTD